MCLQFLHCVLWDQARCQASLSPVLNNYASAEPNQYLQKVPPYTSCHEAKIWLSHSQVFPYKECANFDIASLTQVSPLNEWMVPFHTRCETQDTQSSSNIKICMYYTCNVQCGALETLLWCDTWSRELICSEQCRAPSC